MKEICKNIIIWILQAEAKLVLWRYKPKIVTVTGSVGKTSTKDVIYTALVSSFFVRKSEKSFNGDIGVPLTILGLQNAWSNPFLWIENIVKGLAVVVVPKKYPAWLVLEVGADRPKDIEKIMAWVKPDVAVITRIGEVPVHVEFFKDRSQLVYEKSWLARAVKPTGTLILNADDAEVLNFRTLTQAKVMTVSQGGVGQTENLLSDIVAQSPEIYYENDDVHSVPLGIRFTLTHQGEAGQNKTYSVVRKGIVGSHHLYPALFAFAVAVGQGIAPEKVVQALSAEVNTPGRMRLLKAVKGGMIIDDTYNASPVAMKEAIQALGQVHGRRKIAVLGDMMELGKHSADAHYQAGLAVGKVADILVTVGMRARRIAEGALDAGLADGAIMQFDYAQTAGKYVEGIIQPKDIVLVKGSQSVRLERAVQEFMSDPEKKEHLLVRQDAEWQKR